MALIPVFKECTRKYLEEKWEVTFSLADWVSIELPLQEVMAMDNDLDPSLFEMNDKVAYETNKYDVTFRDREMGKIISVYIYMDESSSKIIAIDSVVVDQLEEDTTYPIEETPFGDMLETIREK